MTRLVVEQMSQDMFQRKRHPVAFRWRESLGQGSSEVDPKEIRTRFHRQVIGWMVEAGIEKEVGLEPVGGSLQSPDWMDC